MIKTVIVAVVLMVASLFTGEGPVNAAEATKVTCSGLSDQDAASPGITRIDYRYCTQADGADWYKVDAITAKPVVAPAAALKVTCSGLSVEDVSHGIIDDSLAPGAELRLKMTFRTKVWYDYCTRSDGADWYKIHSVHGKWLSDRTPRCIGFDKIGFNFFIRDHSKGVSVNPRTFYVVCRKAKESTRYLHYRDDFKSPKLYGSDVDYTAGIKVVLNQQFDYRAPTHNQQIIPVWV